MGVLTAPVYIQCDACLTWWERFAGRTATIVRGQLRVVGWARTGGRDLCPCCQGNHQRDKHYNFCVLCKVELPPA